MLVMLDAFRLCIWRQRSGRLSAMDPSAVSVRGNFPCCYHRMKKVHCCSLLVHDYLIYFHLLSAPSLSLYSRHVTHHRSCAIFMWMHWHRYCNQPFWMRSLMFRVIVSFSFLSFSFKCRLSRRPQVQFLPQFQLQLQL